MSGIAGIISYDGAPAQLPLLRHVAASMKDRGPDGAHLWSDGSASLACCQLRTTPEARFERQPVRDEHGLYVLVFDGRIDNREELHKGIALAGLRLRDESDAEFVMQAYKLWGEKTPELLLGDFAFAVWHLVDKKLFCTQDHFSARSIFYVQTDWFFAFASDDEALLGLPGISARPNEDLIASLFVPSFEDFRLDRSWIHDVRALEQAQFLIASPDRRLRVQTYWKLEACAEDRYASDEECQEAFLSVFGEAVRCRLRVEGQPAAMLSGGMDSASIAAMVQRLLPAFPGKTFNTYSAIADEPGNCIESQCIRRLTASDAINPRFVCVPSLRGMVSAQDVVAAAWSRAHPVDNDLLLPSLMCLAASRNGERVLLHGASGDLTTYFPERYAAHLLRAGRWRLAWRECQAAVRNNNYLRGQSAVHLFLLNAWSAYVPASVRESARRLRRHLDKRAEPIGLLDSAFASKIRLGERLMGQFLAERRARLTTIQDDRVSLLRGWGIASGLAGFGRAGARHGIEPRDPWADRRLVRFFVGLPFKNQTKLGWNKYIVRSALSSQLPHEVAWRLGKEHLGWTVVCRLMDDSEALLNRMLAGDFGILAEYVDRDIVEATYRKYRATKADADREAIFRLVTLLTWSDRCDRKAESYRGGDPLSPPPPPPRIECSKQEVDHELH